MPRHRVARALSSERALRHSQLAAVQNYPFPAARPLELRVGQLLLLYTLRITCYLNRRQQLVDLGCRLFLHGC
jgi:hypothetical protein